MEPLKNNNQSVRKQFCTFRIDRHFFGINILDVKEIVDHIELTKIHHAPEEILGFINIRGHVHLVIDLRLLLKFEKKNIDENTRIILFTPDVGESFGILVDQIGHMVEVEEKFIEYRQHEEKQSDLSVKRMNALEIAACKLDDKLLVILEARRFLQVIKT
jgi:chemotaxis signal transduction protein